MTALLLALSLSQEKPGVPEKGRVQERVPGGARGRHRARDRPVRVEVGLINRPGIPLFQRWYLD